MGWAETLASTPRWRPVDAPLHGFPGQRSPADLLAIVAQFDVEHCTRYAPGDGATWCNVFAWDVTRALGAEVPHWADDEGRPTAPGATGARELCVNALVDWLGAHGDRLGWRMATPEQARHVANLGLPVVATWTNNGKHGHIAVVLPSGELGPLLIAQAGARCFSCAAISEGFGSHVADVEFWCHS